MASTGKTQNNEIMERAAMTSQKNQKIETTFSHNRKTMPTTKMMQISNAKLRKAVNADDSQRSEDATSENLRRTMRVPMQIQIDENNQATT
jgi:hypothetical protein